MKSLRKQSSHISNIATSKTPVYSRRVSKIIRKKTVLEHPRGIVPQNVMLKMLGWYLEEKLSLQHPELFSGIVQVKPIATQGVSNYTFRVDSKDGLPLVVRVKERPQNENRNTPWAAYHKELWIYEQLRTTIPIPRIYKTCIDYIDFRGMKNEISLMLQDFIPYSTASNFITKQTSLEFGTQIGSITRKINSLVCTGFGGQFLVDQQRFSINSWQEYIAAEFEQLKLPLLLEKRIFSKNQFVILQERISQLIHKQVQPKLFHGDLIGNWGNIFVNPFLDITGIIDWEFAGSGMSTEFELATGLYVLFRDGKSINSINEEFTALLKGYFPNIQELNDDTLKDCELFLLLHALKKTQRYIAMQNNGVRLTPWQKTFQQNAINLIQILLTSKQGHLITKVVSLSKSKNLC